MAHFRYTTFNSLSRHISSLHDPTQASNTRSRLSSSISPSNSFWGPTGPLPRPRLEDNDFQSNAQAQANSSFDSSLLGLGIHLVNPVKTSPEEDAAGLKIKSSNIPFHPQIDGNPGQSGDRPETKQDEFTSFFEPQLSCSWSAESSISKSRSLAAVSNTSCPSDNNNVTSHCPNSENAAEWSLNSFAAASGISTHILAEQLSSTADLALRYMTEGYRSSFSSLMDLDSSNDVFVNDNRRTDWPILPDYRISTTPVLEPATGRLKTEPPVGVNPADIMGDILYDSDQSRISFALSTSMSLSSHNSLDGFVAPAHTGKRRKRLSPEVLSDIRAEPQDVVATSGGGKYHILQPTGSGSNKENYDYELPLQDASSEDSSPFPSPRPRKRVGQPKKKTKNPNRKIPLLRTFIPPPQLRPVKVEEDEVADINFGTPVFDAHKGVHIDDLKAKAERYRLRNPGQSYDNRWLVSFVGKLSSRGELVNEFRCYVIGCTQMNKRRDHILIHVGAHLDQRPFECSFCPTRFLRKNECKRHELSHSGNRPFLCDICPPGTAFVRQDLLRRHMARTHGARRKS